MFCVSKNTPRMWTSGRVRHIILVCGNLVMLKGRGDLSWRVGTQFRMKTTKSDPIMLREEKVIRDQLFPVMRLLVEWVIIYMFSTKGYHTSHPSIMLVTKIWLSIHLRVPHLPCRLFGLVLSMYGLLLVLLLIWLW